MIPILYLSANLDALKGLFTLGPENRNEYQRVESSNGIVKEY